MSAREATMDSVDRPERRPAGGPRDRRLEVRQALAVARLELWRNFFGLRALGLYLVVGFPVLVAAISAFVRTAGFAGDEVITPGSLSQEYGVFANQLLVRLVIFFVCLLIFTRLFRTEVQQRSLHYYFLAPVRRGVVVAGKFLAGVTAALVLLGISTTTSFLLYFLPLTREAGSASYGSFLLQGGGLGQLAAYLGVVALGVVGYGAIFLAIGLFFGNPIVPAILLFFWELANFLLPPVLKRVSVIHHLSALQPVPVPEGVIALVAEPPSPWLAVPALLVVAAAMVVLSAWKVRRLEIHYGEE